MLTNELLKLYKDNVEVRTRVEKIYVPKRHYKRPDLQRLANRWYGMVWKGEVEVDILARPKTEELHIPHFNMTPAYLVAGAELPESVTYQVKTYKLRAMGYRFKSHQESYHYELDYAIRKFWYEIRNTAAIEIL